MGEGLKLRAEEGERLCQRNIPGERLCYRITPAFEGVPLVQLWEVEDEEVNTSPCGLKRRLKVDFGRTKCVARRTLSAFATLEHSLRSVLHSTVTQHLRDAP